MKNILFSTLILCGALMLQGCVGLVIGTATDAAIAVAKVPFKVGGAVIDVVAGDEEDEED
ncbi:MAG: NF038104 family lipoprotein [Thiothrix sp.]|nr:NF038104 family lipoprotein [Thiothrix sp.]HPE59630.1 NF038104 family lipoprotein [Thiolinea sp.]